MVDLHTHILPGICDGAKSIDESINIIKEGIKYGVTDFVMTPHYIIGTSYNADNKVKIKLIEEIKNKLKKDNIKANIYIGNEVFVCNDLLELNENNFISTINNSNYLLLELPMSDEFKGVNDVVFKLKCENINSIIAHPERYSYFNRNPKKIEELINRGVLFQCNIGSFFGQYGKDVQKLVMLLLKHKAISFIASDVHNEKNNCYAKIEKLKKILSRYLSNEEIEDILVNNALKVINNEEIKVENIEPFKKSIFGKWK